MSIFLVGLLEEKKNGEEFIFKSKNIKTQERLRTLYYHDQAACDFSTFSPIIPSSGSPSLTHHPASCSQNKYFTSR